MNEQSSDVTELLAQVREHSGDAERQLYQLVYDELRKLARLNMRRENASHTLQATALVHEAYVRLKKDNRVFQNRAHFYRVAGQIMRRILVDHARAKVAGKRGGGANQVELPEFPGPVMEPEKMLALDEALLRLSKMDERQGRIVELRFFCGMTEEQIGEVLGVSSRTVKRNWTVARAWLYEQIGR
jgi:RNA polymerase sigma factor (TIGR02999 family)